MPRWLLNRYFFVSDCLSDNPAMALILARSKKQAEQIAQTAFAREGINVGGDAALLKDIDEVLAVIDRQIEKCPEQRELLLDRLRCRVQLDKDGNSRTIAGLAGLLTHAAKYPEDRQDRAMRATTLIYQVLNPAA